MILGLLPRFLLSPVNLLRRAVQRSFLGKWEDASKDVDAVLSKLQEVYPNLKSTPSGVRDQFSGAWFLKGKIHENTANPAAATQAYLYAFGLGKTDDHALCFLTAELLKTKDQREEAKRIYLAYLSRAYRSDMPERVKTNFGLIQAISVPNLSSAKATESTRQWNERILAARDDWAWVHQNLGGIAAAQGDWQRAAAAFSRALHLDPSDALTRHTLAYLLFRSGNFSEAKQHLDTLLAGNVRQETAILRAQVLRCLGDPSGAALDFQRANEIRSLSETQRLVYAEVLLNAENSSQAVEVLDSSSVKNDAKWRFLKGVAERNRGRIEDALAGLRLVASDVQLHSQAAQQIVLTAAQNPATPGALVSLDAIGEQDWNDDYWTCKGHVLLQTGAAAKALECWHRVASPHSELVKLIQSVGKSALASLYNQGDDEGVLGLLFEALAPSVVSFQMMDIVAAAVARRILKWKQQNEQPAEELPAILDQLEAKLPESRLHPQIVLLRGLLHCSEREYERAWPLLSVLPESIKETDEVIVQLATCALHRGDTACCATILNRLKFEDDRTARLRCALAAMDANWEVAFEGVQRLSFAPEEASIPLAISVQAGRFSWADPYGNGASAIAYYAAVNQLKQGEIQASTKLLAAISEYDFYYPAVRRLNGWLCLQEAQELQRAGKEAQAASELAKALELWPGDDGPHQYFANAPEELALTYLLADERNKAREVLQEQCKAMGIAEPCSCHNLAVFYFSEGLENIHKDLESGLAYLEKSLAYLAISLSDGAYIEEWVEQRSVAYGIKLPAEIGKQLESYVVSFCAGEFTRCAEALKGSGLLDGAGRVSDLVLALRAELRSSRLLHQIGGFPSREQEEVCAGPIYVSHHGLQQDLSQFLSSTPVSRVQIPAVSPEDDLVAWLEAVLQEDDDQENAIQADTKQELERLFSSLRFAVILEADNRSREALQRLRETNPPCVALSVRQICKGGIRTSCPRDQQYFLVCNPAYAGKDGSRRFRAVALEYEIHLLTELGKSEIASTADQPGLGVRYWKEAISIAQEGAQRETVMKAVQAAALGRVKVLREKHRVQEAIAVLEEIGDFYEDSAILGQLSDLYASRGIAAANADLWEDAVDDLRRARECNPHSSFANHNFLIALRSLANRVYNTGPERSRALLLEAVDVIQQCVKADPHNVQLRNVATRVRADLAVLNLQAGEVAATDDILMAMVGQDSSAAKRLSVFYHNRGVEKVQAGDIAGAIDHLERAFDLEPASEETRIMLAGVIGIHAIVLEAEGRLEEARQELDRGLRVDPGNAGLCRQQKTLALTMALREKD